MPSKTIDVTNGDGTTRSIVIPDRSRYAGVKTIDRNAPPLDKTSTHVQVTIAGHADISGVYNGSASPHSTWFQEGGDGQIAAYDQSPANQGNYSEWLIVDSSDGDPYASFTGTFAQDRPWEASNTGIATFSPVPETITVDRTAPVVTSDKAGASRPLLSKVVGGAAVAYSLRDLNDRNGNNKVVRAMRLTDRYEKDFLAKELSNGTLTSFGNEKTKYFDTTGATGSTISYGPYSSTRQGGISISINPTGGFNGNESIAFTGKGNSSAFSKNFMWWNTLHQDRVGVGSHNRLVTVEAYVKRTSGSSTDFISFRQYASSGNKIAINNLVQDEWTFVTGTLTTNSNSNLSHIQIGGEEGTDFELSNVKYFVTKNDVRVATWYDQSGNNNHATQSSISNQATIVYEGAYLGALSLDGTDHYDLTTSINHKSNFFVGSADLVAPTASSQEANALIGHNTASPQSYVFISPSNVGGMNAYAISLDGNNADNALLKVDGTTISTSGTNVGTNGTTIVSNQEHLLTIVYNSGDPATNADVIFSFNSDYEFRGLAKEFIIYSSDETANVPAIEANINNQYSIYS